MAHQSWRLAAACLMAWLGTAPPAAAQIDRMTPIATPSQPAAIALGTGTLAGATAAESWYRQYGSRFSRNVTEATLTPFLPAPTVASGAAVIVAPGGGFRTLSMDNEGWEVARALAARGVAAFVLKYRLVQTPAGMSAFEEAMRAMFAGTARPAGQPLGTPAPALADARAAFALVRRRAGEWHVDPARVGMLGFSAGAMLTLSSALGGETKPAFIGVIYGPLGPVTVPADAPPLFAALAADDPLMGGGGFELVNRWRMAKRPVEFHLYEQGGHGFGMYRKPTTSTGWFDAFAAWMTMHGWMAAAR